MPDRLNQSQLIARIRRELGLPVGSRTIHLMIQHGLPHETGPGKRPRFRWRDVHAWILEMECPEVLGQAATQDWFHKRRVATPPEFRPGSL